MRRKKKRGPAKDKKTRIPKKYLGSTKGSRRSELASLIKRISKLTQLFYSTLTPNFTKNMTVLPVSLQILPLREKNAVDYSSLYLDNACSVAVQYWVLRPQAKNDT